MAKRNGTRIPVRHFICPIQKVGMTAYKKAPAGTTVEIADRTILPVDGFGTVNKVDLDQPGTTPQQIKRVSAAFVQGFRPTCCPLVKLLTSVPARDCFPQ